MRSAPGPSFERSRETSGLPFVYLLKTLIPLFALLIGLQGIAQAIRAALVLSEPRDRRPHPSDSIWRQSMRLATRLRSRWWPPSARCCLIGYPVALTLAGVSLGFAAGGAASGVMNLALLGALPERIFGVMSNEVLLAIPLFIFMGVMLERSRIAEDLLETMGRLFGALPGGLGLSVVFVGVLLAAAKGVVGATTVTMGLIVLPTMLRHGYDKALAAGTVAATATLAQIFPPATVLVLLGDQLSNSYQAAQLAAGQFRAADGFGCRPVRRRHRPGPRPGPALYVLSDRRRDAFPEKVAGDRARSRRAARCCLAAAADGGSGRADRAHPRRARLHSRRHRDADGSGRRSAPSAPSCWRRCAPAPRAC